ncbi:hypothetical protein CRM22_008063 [Opisthorchis felineus]|uniref:Major facilitator superfamily (MFS) profile domain-containing protein n=1 Tax=Opisthorchis felineus TaxID=147828 RepID=A0A4S2LKS1_OPIFE|nr:hypothetical protein CRM22_008063 [Opisthorchis felineus]TGZ61259.1 hypothetical protein CRM22_008063 [Opisthorchis felineus]
MTSRRRLASADESAQEKKTCLSTPTVYHAAIIIFLEFFAFGLLTTPMITVLDETFPKHTFLMNGIIQGVKGFLSFLSAPLLGALSDAIGRKPFLLLTVTFTCSPIPLMKISHWWYFTMISISGIFAVTFSVVLAYVADITTEEDRSWGYGLVSATFAASLVTSPAIGAYLGRIFSEDLVVALATAIAFLDIFFILACVPESLPEKVRASHLCSITGRSGSAGSGKLSWDRVDPFAALRKVTNDYLVLMVCITTFFSYLPEAGQYSCFFVYLRLVLGFSEESVALFIAVVGILSCISQTVVLGLLNTCMGPKQAIIIGLVFEAVQLTLYGFATQPMLLWTAGLVAAMGTVTYPALSAFVSKHAAADQQGVAQGLVTGIRGLCGGLGPALFGLIFYIFQVDLNTQTPTSESVSTKANLVVTSYPQPIQDKILPGPPFAFGAVLVLLAIFVAWFIPENPKTPAAVQSTASFLGGEGGTVESLLGNTSYDRNTLRRPSPATESSCDLVSGDCHDCATFLLDVKPHPKHFHTGEKEHFATAVGEPGLWDRLFSSWSDRRRPLAVRRPNRLFRQPTVSFTRAHFVEPFRRLLTGFSSGRTIIGSDVPQLTVLPSQYTDGVTLDVFGSSDLLRNKPHQIQSRHETEAADLSNYRSHNLKHFLISPSSEADVFTARRFDVSHKNHAFSASPEAAEHKSLLSAPFSEGSMQPVSLELSTPLDTFTRAPSVVSS